MDSNSIDLKKLIRGNTVTEDYIKKHNLEDDFSVTINEAAEALGYSVPHFQSFVLPYLLQVEAEPGGYVKHYMYNKTKNKRIKKVISKKSLINYVGVMIAIQNEYETMYLSKKDSWFDMLKDDYVKTKRNIQLALNRAADELNDIYGKRDEIYNKKRIEKRLKQVQEGNINILHLLEANTFDLDEVKRFYIESNITERKSIEKDDKDIYSIIKDNMYSIRQIREEEDFKHIQQAYRFLDKCSCMQVKMADASGLGATGKISDRNIRYILKDSKELTSSKDYYYIRLSKSCYDGLKSRSDITGGFVSVEQIVKQQIENRIKLMKFDDEEDIVE